jgi:hypothetical protein
MDAVTIHAMITIAWALSRPVFDSVSTEMLLIEPDPDQLVGQLAIS